MEKPASVPKQGCPAASTPPSVRRNCRFSGSIAPVVQSFAAARAFVWCPKMAVPEDQPAVEIVVGGFQIRELDAGSLRGDESVDDLVPGLEDFVASAEVPIGPHRAGGPDDREEPSGAIQVADVDMELHAGRAVRVRDRRVGE